LISSLKEESIGEVDENSKLVSWKIGELEEGEV
jgi:hypothetical protein